MKNKVNTFWDLDGVIFKYEREAYVGDNPTYANPGYFRKREIDNVAYALLEKARKDASCTINILSRGSTRLDEEQRKNIIEDKKNNVSDVIPWLPDTNILITELSKVEEAVLKLGRSLSKNDILIDDFNENLISWTNAGGSAIKYLNGLNSESSYDGPKLKNGVLIDASDDVIYRFLK